MAGIGLEPGVAKFLETQHTIREIKGHILGGGIKASIPVNVRNRLGRGMGDHTGSI